MQVVWADASLTAKGVAFHFLEWGVDIGACHTKALEILTAAGIVMLQGVGVDMHQVIAEGAFTANYCQSLANLDQTM